MIDIHISLSYHLLSLSAVLYLHVDEYVHVDEIIHVDEFIYVDENNHPKRRLYRRELCLLYNRSIDRFIHLSINQSVIVASCFVVDFLHLILLLLLVLHLDVDVAAADDVYTQP